MNAARPHGRDAVREALVQAAIDCIMDEGLGVSVRRIASRAEVNHGLVHAYFENKQDLLSAAVDAIHARASRELDDDGFPPPDLASRRGGELARAVARIQLDGGKDLGSSNPISTAWKAALATARPELGSEAIDSMVATASALGLGWALFADHLSELLGVSPEQRLEIDHRISRLIAELGGLPDSHGTVGTAADRSAEVSFGAANGAQSSVAGAEPPKRISLDPRERAIE